MISAEVTVPRGSAPTVITVEPLMPACRAVRVACPTFLLATKPLELMLAIEASDEDHVAVALKSFVLPSL